MSKELEFIRECGYFYVLTINGDFPAGRPFGAMMEDENYLYIATHDGNDAHEQLRENEHIQILAKKEGVREWLRITGIVKECSDEKEIKEKFLEECPVLVSHYGNAENEHYLVFRIKVVQSEFK